MRAFEYQDYKKFVRDRISAMPKNGHGQYRKMANFLSINSVNVTQIFKGDRDLTVEQGCLLIDFFGLPELEGQYFVGLVELARAGHHKLRTMIEKRLKEVRAKSENLKDRLSSSELSQATKAEFYSNWYYSAIRLSTSLKNLQSADAIAAHHGLSIAVVNRTLEFLITHGLVRESDGKLTMGPSSTHLEASSPLIGRHHTNWRNKAIEKVSFLSPEELSLSMPCSLSTRARVEVRKVLVNAIEEITSHIDEGPEEELACLNIDWIKL